MNNKAGLITQLKDLFRRWEEQLLTMSEAEITTRQLSPGRSVKDDVAHLRAWLQVSIARLEAAVSGNDPAYPDWVHGTDPDSDSEEDTQGFNERIYQAHREESWSVVYHNWQNGVVYFLELAEKTPEDVLSDKDRFPWLKGYPLLAILQGALEHHEEHMDGFGDRLLQGINHRLIYSSK